MTNTVYAYWAFEDADIATSIVDSKGSHNLEIAGSHTGVTGKIGRGAQMGLAAFGPSYRNPYATTSADWDLSGTDWTIRAWIYIPAYTGIDRTWISTNSSFALIYEATGLMFYAWSNSTYYQIGAPVTVAAWNRVVIYQDSGSSIGIIINNGAPVTASMPEALASGNERFQIGSTNFEETFAIDEVGFWKRLLTPAELLNDWNSGAGRTYPDVP